MVVLDTPFPIKAGELVGHIGNYHDYEAGINKEKDKEGKLQNIETLPEDTLQRPCFKPLLHVECFTCEDLPKYITQTKTEAGKLNDTDKPFLAISKGAKLLVTPNQGDTTVGKPYKDTKIKVISKNVGINWIQLEIKSSETETKTLWIENTEEIAKTAKPNREITLNENTVAWSQHPLQVSELSKSSQTVDMPVLLYLNDEKLTLRDKRAEDEQGTLWWKAEALDEKNLPIVGWVSTAGEEIKKVSAWDWFDFTQLTENASLLEFYKNVALSEQRNKDAPSLDKYQPTLKAALSVLDRQYPTETQQYAYIEDKCFRGIIEKPILFEALGRLLVNYESEWYSEIDTEGKMPKWEALNSVMTEDAENVLGYLKDGDEAKLNTYLSNKGLSQNAEEALMLKNQQEKVCKMPTDYYEKKKSLLTPNELALYLFMKYLEKQVAIWQQEKEKIKKCLWWDDVVKGLANQKQPTSEANASNENGADTNNQTAQTKTKTPPAKLNQDGKAWFIHPISIMMLTNYKKDVIFPLKVKPINNFDMQFGANYNWTKNNNQTMFGWGRSGGTRKHAARDLYTEPYAEIVAVSDGVVLEVKDFYSRTYQITIKHETWSGRQFIIRYGEVDKESIKVKVGDCVKQGTVIAKTGFLLRNFRTNDDASRVIVIKINGKDQKFVPEMVINGKIIYMLHLEYYSGNSGLNLKKPLSNKTNKPYERRKDLLDPLDILKEGYRNSFGEDPQ